MNKLLRLLTGGLFAAFFAIAAQAADLAPGAYSVGSVRGNVTYKVPGSDQFQRLTPGIALPQGAVIRTGAGASALIVFGSGSMAAIAENSEIEVTKFEQAMFSGPIPVDVEPAVSNTEIRIINGAVTSKVAKLKPGSSYTVNTPVGAAGVRGTIFRVSYNRETGAFGLTVAEGAVSHADATETTLVPEGQELLGTFDATNGTFGGKILQLVSPEDLQALLAVFNVNVGAALEPERQGMLILNPVDTTQISVSPN